MKSSLQKMNNDAIGYIGESIAKKLIPYSRRCIFSDFKKVLDRYSSMNDEVREFLRINWNSFDLVKILEKPEFKVQIIEVKTSTKRYGLKRKNAFSLTPKTVELYKQAKILGIEVLFLHLIISQEWIFDYKINSLNVEKFCVSQGGYGKKGFFYS